MYMKFNNICKSVTISKFKFYFLKNCYINIKVYEGICIRSIQNLIKAIMDFNMYLSVGKGE